MWLPSSHVCWSKYSAFIIAASLLHNSSLLMSNEGTSAESDVTDEMQYAFDGCVFSKNAWEITNVTSGSSLPRGAEAPSWHRITLSVVFTVTDVDAALTVATPFARWVNDWKHENKIGKNTPVILWFQLGEQIRPTSVTARSVKSWKTDTLTRHRVTGGAVHTVTLHPTQRAVETRGAG